MKAPSHLAAVRRPLKKRAPLTLPAKICCLEKRSLCAFIPGPAENSSCSPFLRMCACFPAIPGGRGDLCLFWQGRESLDTQSKPLTLLTVWDWSVQFEPKAQTLLRNPLYVEKPKLDKGQRKGSRFKVRCACLNTLPPTLAPPLHACEDKGYFMDRSVGVLPLIQCAVGTCGTQVMGLISGAFSKSAFALMKLITEAAVVRVVLHGIVPLTLCLCVW